MPGIATIARQRQSDDDSRPGHLVAMEGGGVSTLVLIDDRELELRVSSSLVSFSAWATQAYVRR